MQTLFMRKDGEILSDILVGHIVSMGYMHYSLFAIFLP